MSRWRRQLHRRHRFKRERFAAYCQRYADFAGRLYCEAHGARFVRANHHLDADGTMHVDCDGVLYEPLKTLRIDGIVSM